MVEDVIRAKRFEVVDDEGRPRVIVGAQPTAAGLLLLDANGSTVAELAVSDEHGAVALTLYDLRGQARATLDLDANGAPNLALHDMAGEARVSLAVDEEESATVLDFTGPYGEARFSIEIDKEGLPSLAMMDSKGEDRAILHVDRKGNPRLQFLDERGREVSGDASR